MNETGVLIDCLDLVISTLKNKSLLHAKHSSRNLDGKVNYEEEDIHLSGLHALFLYR